MLVTVCISCLYNGIRSEAAETKRRVEEEFGIPAKISSAANLAINQSPSAILPSVPLVQTVLTAGEHVRELWLSESFQDHPGHELPYLDRLLLRHRGYPFPEYGEWMRSLHRGQGIPRACSAIPMQESGQGHSAMPSAPPIPVQPWQDSQHWSVGRVNPPWGNLTPSNPSGFGATFEWQFDVKGLPSFPWSNVTYGYYSHLKGRMQDGSQDTVRYAHFDDRPGMVSCIQYEMLPLVHQSSLWGWISCKPLREELQVHGVS